MVLSLPSRPKSDSVSPYKAQAEYGFSAAATTNRAAIKEMHRQVGDLQINEQGIATRGLLVRHLVLPHRLSGTAQVVRFLAEEVSKNTYLNVMAQYHPCHKASQFPSITRTITGEEFQEATSLARQQGLERLDRPYFSRRVRVLFQ